MLRKVKNHAKCMKRYEIKICKIGTGDFEAASTAGFGHFGVLVKLANLVGRKESTM